MSEEPSEHGAPPGDSQPAPAESAPGPVPHPTGIRASDAEREQLISELNEHMVDGRIGTEELEERTQAAYAARTTAELDALRHDLPPTARQVARYQKQRRAHLTRRMIQETGGLGTVFVIGTAIWISDGASGQFWPIWVLLILVLSVARNAWGLYGPAPDLDAVERDLDRRRNEQRSRRRSHPHQ
ncbi:MAG: DUF1707 domain-containing protein [Solirubrobacteraceae bacterium]